VALNVMANVVYIFIIFGAILAVTGAGEIFIDLAYMLTGRYAGGPAQSAVVASAFFGSINGSGPANVVSTGSFTIPLMKRIGFKPEFAAGVEATASCVGQIMPPIMGVGAFIMSEITGIPYGKIMIAAVFPALLYSFSLIVNVRQQALKRGIERIPESEIPRFNKSLIGPIAVLALSIGVILYRILSGQTPATAGISGAVTLIAASFFVAALRPGFRKIIEMFVRGGRDGLNLTISCAGIGIIIGGISATGMGVKFSQAIIGVGETNLAAALIMAAICCLMIGMGLPTAASYLMVVFIAAPAITKLGLPLLTAHLFIFYYAVMSAITPPVALCAYAGAGIAQSDPLKTGITAVRLGTIGFVLPFLWVYNPELMFRGEGFFQTVWVLTACTVGVIFFASGNIGYLRRSLRPSERGGCIALAVCLVAGVEWLRLSAFILGAVFYVVALKPAGSPSAERNEAS
jgi:TRAP transporter 4TM/12TM fusion protein